MEYELHANPTGRDFPCWTDGDGVTWEYMYVVTQFDAEGPEYLQARPLWNGTGPTPEWYKLADGDISPELDKALEDWFFPKAEIYNTKTGNVVPNDWSGESEIEGIILVMSEGPLSSRTDNTVLAISFDGDLFFCDLVAYEQLTNADSGEVKPGDAIRVQEWALVEGPKQLRDWLDLYGMS